MMSETSSTHRSNYDCNRQIAFELTKLMIETARSKHEKVSPDDIRNLYKDNFRLIQDPTV